MVLVPNILRSGPCELYLLYMNNPPTTSVLDIFNIFQAAATKTFSNSINFPRTIAWPKRNNALILKVCYTYYIWIYRLFQIYIPNKENIKTKTKKTQKKKQIYILLLRNFIKLYAKRVLNDFLLLH